MKNLRLLYQYLSDLPESLATRKKFGREVAFAVMMLIVMELVDVARMWPLQKFFDGLADLSAKGDTSTVNSSLIILVAIIATLSMMRVVLYHMMDKPRLAGMWSNFMWILSQGHRKLMAQDFEYHINHGTGEKDTVLTKSVEKLDRLGDQLIFDSVPAMIRIIAIAIGFLFISWHYSLVVILTCLVYFLIAKRTQGLSGPDQKTHHEQRKKFFITQSEQVNNWRTIKMLGQEKSEFDKLSETRDYFLEEERIRFARWSVRLTRQNAVTPVATVVAFMWMVSDVSSDIISMGDVVVITSWLVVVHNNLWQFTHLQQAINEATGPLNELVETLQIVPVVQATTDHRILCDVKGKLELVNASFCYPKTNRKALSCINLTIQPGETLALMGKSGSGKSTLAGMLLRQFDPSDGAIRLDGVDLRELNIDWLRSDVFSIVDQHIELFDGTVRDNIRFGCEKATDEDVLLAAKRAHVVEFIKDFDMGFDSRIGENGIRTSGGERQRIALARALVRRPNILVLDEATSGLDPESQAIVQAGIDELIVDKSCTLIIIAHRLSTLRDADHVAVMDAGRIVQYGTHQELSEQDGIYADLTRIESGVLSF